MRIRLTALMLAAVLTLAAFAACAGRKEGEKELPSETQTEIIKETPDAEATFRRSTLYYVSDEGYIVPVTKLIPWETGIAKACLKLLVATPENVSAAQRMGMKTAVPEGAEFTISIKDGNALVDITGSFVLPSVDAELNMIRTIVNTLTEFPTVSTVTVTRNGRGGSLENGAELPIKTGPYPLNPENGELAASAGASPVTLWFPNMSGAVTVPVTRYMSSLPSAYSAVAALIEGSKLKGLMSCFPENTLLLGAAVENGRATLDLSSDFKEAAETEGMYSLAYRTVYLTLSELYDIDSLEFRVNGEVFAPEEVSPPEYVNEAGRE